MNGFSGLTARCSGGARRDIRMARARYWSMGALVATMTATDRRSAAARPACCHIEAMVRDTRGRRVEVTDVDAELERARGHHPAPRPSAVPAPPPAGAAEVAATVAAHDAASPVRSSLPASQLASTTSVERRL